MNEDYYNVSPFDDEKDWEKIEAQIDLKSAARILELQINPKVVEGNYDAEHLRKIHGHIFQDSVEYMNAGNFREPTDPKYHHAKQRHFYDDDHYMFYAGEPTDKSVNKVINKGVEKLANATDKKEFSVALADFYAKIDYQHPFYEGNSRTLREFTRLMAKSNGYDLDWDDTNKNKRSNNELYVARDSHLIDQNFNFSSKNMIYLKAFNPSLYSQHCEYRRVDMVDYLAEYKKVNGFRNLPEIIESNLFELSQKLDNDLDEELLYDWQKDYTKDPIQAIDDTLKTNTEHNLDQQQTQSEPSTLEQTPRSKRRRP